MDQPLLHRLIDAFTCLPGVGSKTARRFVYFLLGRNRQSAVNLCETLRSAIELVRQCDQCRMFSEEPLCRICRDAKREQSLLCIVEGAVEVMTIESNTGFRGKYFVLHGRLSPLDGIGPEEIGMGLLEAQLADGKIKELILATGATVEGNVTAHLISELAARYDVNTTRLAQGVPIGGDLEFVDATTLSHAFETRRQY